MDAKQARLNERKSYRPYRIPDAIQGLQLGPIGPPFKIKATKTVYYFLVMELCSVSQAAQPFRSACKSSSRHG